MSIRSQKRVLSLTGPSRVSGDTINFCTTRATAWKALPGQLEQVIFVWPHRYARRYQGWLHVACCARAPIPPTAAPPPPTTAAVANVSRPLNTPQGGGLSRRRSALSAVTRSVMMAVA